MTEVTSPFISATVYASTLSLVILQVWLSHEASRRDPTDILKHL